MQTPLSFKQGGRFGNQFFGNMGLHFLSQAYRIPVKYLWIEAFEELGLAFHNQAPRMLMDPITTITIRDDATLVDHMTNDCSGNYILNVDDSNFQTKGFVLFLAKHFAKPEIQAPIRQANPFRNRYGTNRSVFVHVRLGDVVHRCPSKDYFDKALQAISFEDGYISSDSPNHPLVQTLAATYSLKILHQNIIELIQWASTCRYHVLSNGSFSFLMGLLAFDTELVQWPQIKQTWHGDIFVIPEWKEVLW